MDFKEYIDSQGMGLCLLEAVKTVDELENDYIKANEEDEYAPGIVTKPSDGCARYVISTGDMFVRSEGKWILLGATPKSEGLIDRKDMLNGKLPTNEECGKTLIDYSERLEANIGHPTVFSKGIRLYGEAMQDNSTLSGLNCLLKIIDLFNTKITEANE